MGDAQLLLEVALVLLLGVTLFHAVRLERALGVLKRDRAVLEELVAGFNDSTRQAELGVERLRAATDGAGRQIARQIEQAQRLKDDLAFLAERGERIAERLESAVRSSRMAGDQTAMGSSPGPGHNAAGAMSSGPLSSGAMASGAMSSGAMASGAMSSGAMFSSAGTTRGVTPTVVRGNPPMAQPLQHFAAQQEVEPPGGQKLRSEAERELLRALRAAR